jgi:hypothetical protein
MQDDPEAAQLQALFVPPSHLPDGLRGSVPAAGLPLKLSGGLSLAPIAEWGWPAASDAGGCGKSWADLLEVKGAGTEAGCALFQVHCLSPEGRRDVGRSMTCMLSFSQAAGGSSLTIKELSVFRAESFVLP